jgi:hypothetical protein
MQNLALHPRPKYPDDIPPTLRGETHFVVSRIRRFVNKLLGFAATHETAILATLLSQLQSATEAFLGENFHVKAAVVSSPNAIRFTAEEISDTLDYLRIQDLLANPDQLFGELYHTSAAYARFGDGLCPEYTNPEKCYMEEAELPYVNLLHIDFSDVALSMTIREVKTALGSGSQNATVAPDLGFTQGETRGHLLFDEIRNHIGRFARSWHWKIEAVILTGTAASDPRFKDAVKDALVDIIKAEAIQSLHSNAQASDMDLTFATAKGAAEIAKRYQEGPVRCQWSKACKRALRQAQRSKEVEVLEL